MVNSSGYLLVYPLADLPMMKKGKGNKLIDLKNDETVVAITTLKEGDNLLITSGKRTITLKADDVKNFMGNRGRRGGLLPKGFQKVSGVEKI